MANGTRNEAQRGSSVDLRKWSRGDSLTARRLNEPVEVINRLLSPRGRVVQTPFVVQPTQVELQQFRVKSVQGDYLTCRTLDGATEGAVDVFLAKPFLLRKTPFDGKTRAGISYTYASDIERTATKGSDTEIQVIVPSYVLDDVVYGATKIKGDLNVAAGVVGSSVDVEFLDLNVDGRAWAKKA